MDTFLNDGIKTACIDGDAYLSSFIFTASNNVAAYKIPWQILKIKNILNSSGAPVEPITQENLGSIYTVTGYPSYYFVDATPLTLSNWASGATYYMFDPTLTLPTSFPTLTYVTSASYAGYMFESVLTGASGLSEPSFTYTLGGLSTDNGVSKWITLS